MSSPRSGARYNSLVTTLADGAVWCGDSALPHRLGKDEPEAEPMHYSHRRGLRRLRSVCPLACSRLSRTRAFCSNHERAVLGKRPVPRGSRSPSVSICNPLMFETGRECRKPDRKVAQARTIRHCSVAFVGPRHRPFRRALVRPQAKPLNLFFCWVGQIGTSFEASSLLAGSRRPTFISWMTPRSMERRKKSKMSNPHQIAFYGKGPRRNRPYQNRLAALVEPLPRKS